MLLRQLDKNKTLCDFGWRCSKGELSMTNERMKMLQTLEEKKDLFAEMEQLSDQMLAMDADELGQAYEQRQKLMDQAAELDKAIRTMCEEDPQARDAVNHVSQPEDAQLRELYDVSRAIKAAASRILEGEEYRRKHVEVERDKAKKKIEELNKSGSSVAMHYLDSMQKATEVFPKRRIRNF